MSALPLPERDPAAPTPRHFPLRYHPVQRALYHTRARFCTVPAGRRSGKTELLKRRLVRAALVGTPYMPSRFFAGAPIRQQAKNIFWQDLKAMTPAGLILGRPMETELTIKLFNWRGHISELVIVGLDVPERIEGQPWDGGGITEFANVHPDAWPRNIRPALSDRNGWCWLEGVPEGRNHYYHLDLRARADETGEWASFHWKSAEILPAAEIEQLRHDLDPVSFDQELNASFVDFAGRVYYTFNRNRHATRLREFYDPRQTLIVCLDFNVEPGCAAIAQEMVSAEGEPFTAVIGEVWIPRNSNTPMVMRKVVEDWSGHRGGIEVYGDASGGAEKTSAVEGSDWALVRRILDAAFPRQVRYFVPLSNPDVKARINALNSRIESVAGDARLFVDPAAAPHVVLDLEGVRWIEGAAGEIDKKTDKERTHITDALGYYVAYRFPVRGTAGIEQFSVMGV